MARRLLPAIGHTILQGETKRKHSVPVPVGSRIVDVVHKGKFIAVVLDNGCAFATEPRLGGSWAWQQLSDKPAHFKLELDDGSTLYFFDTSGTARSSIVTREELQQKLDSLGASIESTTEEYFVRTLRQKHSKKKICAALLDQKHISGVGNYMKCDALYLAKVSPHCKVSDLTDDQLLLLHSKLLHIYSKSYSAGGHKYNDGSYQPYIYNRKDVPGYTQEKTKDGRTTHWCTLEQQ